MKRILQKYNCIFSILAHEHPEVVIDQLINIRHFNPQSAVVLHINKEFDWNNDFVSKEQFCDTIKKMENVYINPQHLSTSYGDIIHCHISNYRNVASNLEFDYFIICSSNELFVNEGIESSIKEFDCGGEAKLLEYDYTWGYRENAKTDKVLALILSCVGGKDAYLGQVEGSYYKKDIFSKIVEILDKFYDYCDEHTRYPREEVYFRTVAEYIVSNDKVSYHNTAYMNWHNGMVINLRDILKVKVIKEYYSVKRVDRELNNPIRGYIRQYIGHYDDDLCKMIPAYKRNKIVLAKVIYQQICFDMKQIVKGFMLILCNKVHLLHFTKK